MGDTRSHQAGIHVPKGLAYFFPTLDESSLNPRSNMLLESEYGITGMCTYIHYNNKVVRDGTRDEYRITRIRSFLAQCGARTGDTIELSRLAGNQYHMRIVPPETPLSDTVVLDLSRGWKTVRA